MTHQQVIEVAMDDLLDNEDLAKAEMESAKQAALIAQRAATEAQGNGMPADLRREWARMARDAVGLAWAHALRAEVIMPNSAVARAARDHVALAKTHAKAAEASLVD